VDGGSIGEVSPAKNSIVESGNRKGDIISKKNHLWIAGPPVKHKLWGPLFRL